MWSEVQKSKKILVIPPLTPNTGSACTAAAFSSCHGHTWPRLGKPLKQCGLEVTHDKLTLVYVCSIFITWASTRGNKCVTARKWCHVAAFVSFFLFNLVAIKCKSVSSKHWRCFSPLVHLSPTFWFIPPAIKYNVSIAERRFNPRAVLDNPSKMQLQNLTLLPGEEPCEHIYFHVMVRDLTGGK